MKNRIITLLLFLMPTLSNGENWHNAQTIETNLLWNKTLEGVDFLKNKDLYSRMLYVYPQEKSSFKSIEGCSPGKYLSSNYRSITKSFFKGDALSILEGLEPVGYFLGEKYETSLLLREGEHEGVNFSIQESQSAILLNFHSEELMIGGVTSGEVENLLINHFNINQETIESYQLFDSVEVIPTGWHTKVSDEGIFGPNDWKDSLTIFVTKKGVSFLLFKVFEENMRAGPIPNDLEWLNKYLCDQDGNLIDGSYEYYKPSGVYGRRVRKKAQE